LAGFLAPIMRVNKSSSNFSVFEGSITALGLGVAALISRPTVVLVAAGEFLGIFLASSRIAS
jgi:hypothetical protein